MSSNNRAKAMKEDYLDKIPRRDAELVLAQIPGGPGYEQRVQLQLESEMNIAWWRGYYAGRRAEAKESK